MTRARFYPLSERRHRISVDIDGNRRLRMLIAYLTMRHLFPDAAVTVQATRHGYHVKAVGVERTTAQNLQVRRLLRDDPLRVAYDELKQRMGWDRYVDTLFSAKTTREGTSVVEPIDPLAAPFWSWGRERVPGLCNRALSRSVRPTRHPSTRSS